MHPDHMIKLVKREVKQELRKLRYGRSAVLHRFPLLFGFLTAVGAIATFSGLSKLLEQIDWLQRNPGILFLFGLLILVLTGTLYKKLR